MRTYALILAAALTGCGTADPDKEQAKPAAVKPRPDLTAYAVADMATLPTCDTLYEGALRYVKTAAAFYVCADGAWEVIDLRPQMPVAQKPPEPTPTEKEEDEPPEPETDTPPPVTTDEQPAPPDFTGGPR
jgi:hypothetical protein